MSETASRLYEVVGWVQNQMQHLDSPSSRLVLWYLAVNAFRSDDNPEGVQHGRVMSGMVPVSKIQRGTGLGERSVRRSLRDLQNQGYIYASMLPGRGKSWIRVFWSGAADEMRADFRDGIKPLPKEFRGPEKPSLKVVKERKDAEMIPFPIRSS